MFLRHMIICFVLKAKQFAPSQNVTNMAMQINTQQIPVVSEQSRKPEPSSQQAAPTGTPATRPLAERPLGNTFPGEGNLQPQPAWRGPGTAMPPISAGPPYPGVTSPGQGGVLNYPGMVSPGGTQPFPTRSTFQRDAGMPYGPLGFPPPPPHLLDPMGMTGHVPEV